MCINNTYSLKNSHNKQLCDILKNTYHKKSNKSNKREILINEFIKKFPKVKLHTIIEVNKYYTSHYNMNDIDIDIDIDNNKIIILNENKNVE